MAEKLYFIYALLQAIFYSLIYLVGWKRKNSKKNKASFFIEIAAIIIFAFVVGILNLIPTTIFELGAIIISILILRKVLKK